MASSIRRIVADALPRVAAVALALGCARPAATPAGVPGLEIETGPAHPPGAATNAPAAGGAELLLNAMSEPERDELAKSLAALADDIAVKRNPLVEELDDSYDAKSALGRELFQLAPRLSVATALAPGRWASAEGDFVVRAADGCPDGARCVRATGEATEARARFVAWPLAHSVVLRVSLSEVEALRAGARVKGVDRRARARCRRASRRSREPGPPRHRGRRGQGVVAGARGSPPPRSLYPARVRVAPARSRAMAAPP